MNKIAASQPVVEANPVKYMADLMKPEQKFTFEQ